MRRTRIVTASFDALLVVDGLKLCLSLPSITSFTRILFPVIFSATRMGLFLIPDLSYAITQPIKENSALAGSISSLWQSPFRMSSAENINELGTEFTSGSLHHRYNQSWDRSEFPWYTLYLQNGLITLPVGSRKESRFAVLFATVLTLKWELLLLLFMRFFLAAINLLQPRIIRRIILITEQNDATIIQRWQSFGFIAIIFVLHLVIEYTHDLQPSLFFTNWLLLGTATNIHPSREPNCGVYPRYPHWPDSK